LNDDNANAKNQTPTLKLPNPSMRTPKMMQHQRPNFQDASQEQKGKMGNEEASQKI